MCQERRTEAFHCEILKGYILWGMPIYLFFICLTMQKKIFVKADCEGKVGCFLLYFKICYDILVLLLKI